MKIMGIVRKVDQLGRIVIPKEIRRSLMIEENDPIEIIKDGGSIIIKPYRPNCVICGGVENVVIFNNKKICGSCISGLKNAE